jgi:autotransporter-associated beta strand protein
VSTIVWANTGLSSISRAAISFSFSSADVTRPMILGQFYGSLTYGTASEEERMAQLFSPTNALSGFTPTYTVESALDGPRLASDSWSVLVSDQVKGGGAAVWNSWKLTVEGMAAESGIFRPGASGRVAVSASESTAQVGAALELEHGSSVAAEAGTGKTLRLEGGLTGAGDLDTTTESGGKVVVGGNSADFSGIVKVAGSGTTELSDSRALGTGQLRQTNGNSTVRLNFAGTMSNAISVYKVAFATNGATLAGTTTVNNAEFDVASGDTNTITGQITGSGGVTKTGLGTLVLAGTTTNDFTGASAVNAGTLFLNKTAGATAISGSSIAVNSGGTLLLGAANQISDGTVVNLAGGTLAVGGNTDTVGRLTLSADSIFDFGTAGGLASSFTFGDFNTSAYNGLSVLTINNAAVGSSLVFNVDYTGNATFNTFASKIQFGTTGQFGQISFGTGTTTLLVAIPDARIAWAAGLLCGLIGMVELRRRRPRSARPV